MDTANDPFTSRVISLSTTESSSFYIQRCVKSQKYSWIENLLNSIIHTSMLDCKMHNSIIYIILYNSIIYIYIYILYTIQFFTDYIIWNIS